MCLADIKPKEDGRFTEEEILAFQTIMTDPSYRLVVEFLGQLPGGRWRVRMQGKEDGEDVAKGLVQNAGVAAGENPPVTVPTFKETGEELGKKEPVAVPESDIITRLLQLVKR